jgi:uncharacterized membrane protein YeaQ/YmgE (transglycosylase-associated protein family)
MRLGDKLLGFILNFLIGVAWASVLIGAVTSFFAFSSSSIITALIAAVTGALPGMVAVLLLEYIMLGQDKYEEMKKQTRLLEKLLEQKQ